MSQQDPAGPAGFSAGGHGPPAVVVVPHQPAPAPQAPQRPDDTRTMEPAGERMVWASARNRLERCVFFEVAREEFLKHVKSSQSMPSGGAALTRTGAVSGALMFEEGSEFTAAHVERERNEK